jgi:hypothetical protein
MPTPTSRLAATGPDGVPTLAEVLDRLTHAPTHVQVIAVLAVALLAVLVLDAAASTVRVLVRTAVRARRDRGRPRPEDAVPPWVRTGPRTQTAVPSGPTRTGPRTGPTDVADRTPDRATRRPGGPDRQD